VSELLERARDLLGTAGIDGEPELEPLAGGANNRVFRVRSPGASYLLKQYWREPGERDRLEAEFEFARFARGGGLDAVPEPIARGDDLALYEFVEGAPAAAADVTPGAVALAADFAAGLVALSRAGGDHLPAAAEACFSVASHLDLIGGRVARLGREATDQRCLDLVRSRLAPAWEAVRATAEQGAREPGSELSRGERCVSPSDFGFHNAIVEPGGGVRFIDFEYAGWDDPAKLVCDFFCQPAIPVPEEHLPGFAGRVLGELPDPAAAQARARLLLPCYRIKWVCIMLNEFIPAGSRRRAFARGAYDEAAAQERQLTRAGHALAAVEAATKPG
jgi:aminoglycoside phosphotransferase (APT) family kinase protein